VDGSPVAATKALGHVALTYVVPADNSALAIEGVLSALASRLDGRDAEAIVVENGSTDGTGALRSAKGMGNAYRAGIAASRGARVVLTADDLPFGFDDLEAAEGVDPVVHPVVVGSKGHRDSDADRGLLRAVLSRGFWALRRVVLGIRTLDPQGTFVLGSDWARRIGPQLTEPGYLGTTELCFLAERLGAQPLEVPVRLSPEHRDHRSRVTVRDVRQMAVGLWGIRGGTCRPCGTAFPTPPFSDRAIPPTAARRAPARGPAAPARR
jgi:dolichyl-phosphate beta-glucosyltransferase